MAKPRLQLVGKTFGYLTVVADAGNTTQGKSRWVVECICGTRKVLAASDFFRTRKQVTKSCGCMTKKLIGAGNETHGMSSHPAFHVWRSMRSRCLTRTHPAWKNYGGRGIAICSEWGNSFEAFWLDLGAQYQRGLTLERRDNSKGYSARNCYWATRKEQNNNRRDNHRIFTPWGRVTVSEAAEKSGIGLTTLLYRLSRGVSQADLFKKPSVTNRFQL